MGKNTKLIQPPASRFPADRKSFAKKEPTNSLTVTLDIQGRIWRILMMTMPDAFKFVQ
jgi:hypothetical protein